MTDPMVPVIDISSHQGRVDFTKMRDNGVQAVIVRLLNGKTLDMMAPNYVLGARAVGLLVGGYGFCNPKVDAAGADQMNRLADVAAQLDALDIPPMMDVESFTREAGTLPAISGPELHAWLVDGAAALTARFGARPLVYSNGAYFAGQNMMAGELADCPLVCARYPFYYEGNPQPPADATAWETWLFASTKKRPTIPTGWDAWAGWQFSAGFNRMGATYGVSSGDLDLNLFRADAWQQLTNWRPAVQHPIEVQPTPVEDDMPVFVTNQEPRSFEGANYDPTKIVWVLTGGWKAHVSYPYWAAHGTPTAQPLSNADLDQIPDAGGSLSGTAQVTVNLASV